MAFDGQTNTSVYRRLLIELADMVCRDDFIKLKFYCCDNFGKKILEDITTPTDLWTKLEEKCLVKPGDVSYLKQLCKDVLPDRRDISEMLERYEISFKPQSEPHFKELTNELQIICKNLPLKHRKMFVRRLGLNDVDIDNIIQNVPYDSKEQLWQMLMLCMDKRNITKQDLITALRKCDCNLTADLIL